MVRNRNQGGGSTDVLIVDDDPTSCRLLAKTVEQVAGVRARSFLSPLEALPWAEKHAPPVAFVDYRMPEMDGLRLLRALRELPGGRSRSVVIITASHDRGVRIRALELGATDFLTKPFDPVEVRARTANLIELHEYRMETELRARALVDRTVSLRGEVRRATQAARESEREALVHLARAAEFRDQTTGLHVIRVGRGAALLARALGLDDDEQELLEFAAPLHDVGKIATPDAILCKRARLDESEWTIMRRHAPDGAFLLRDGATSAFERAAEIAQTHHERWDGTGYPDGLAGEDIPLSGRIVAVADVFDALTSERPYKEAWPLERAIAYITENAGAHFDPRVVAAFEEVLPDLVQIRERYADVA